MNEEEMYRVNFLKEEGCDVTAIHVLTGIELESIIEFFNR